MTLDDGGNQHAPTSPPLVPDFTGGPRAFHYAQIASAAQTYLAAEEGREMTPADPKNPAWTEGMTAWAGCPFTGDEAFNVASAVGYIRKKAAEAGRDKKGQETAVELNRMADKLSVTCKKIQQRAIREAEMQAAQAINAAARDEAQWAREERYPETFGRDR